MNDISIYLSIYISIFARGSCFSCTALEIHDETTTIFIMTVRHSICFAVSYRDYHAQPPAARIVHNPRDQSTMGRPRCRYISIYRSI
jgi:hypothetical protein